MHHKLINDLSESKISFRNMSNTECHACHCYLHNQWREWAPFSWSFSHCNPPLLSATTNTVSAPYCPTHFFRSSPRILEDGNVTRRSHKGSWLGYKISVNSFLCYMKDGAAVFSCRIFRQYTATRLQLDHTHYNKNFWVCEWTYRVGAAVVHWEACLGILMH